MIWHKKLGHIGEKGLRSILNKKLVDGHFDYSISKNDFYEHFVFDKENRSSFLKGFYKAKSPLEFIHSNVYGLVDIVSLDKYGYFLSFIDDCLRYTWIILCILNMKFSLSSRNLRP